MAVPYSNSIAQALDGHLRIKEGGDWKYVEDVRIRESGSWRDVKEVYVRHSGSWRLVHEGEHFLFDITLGSNSNTQWSLSSYISGQGYSGNKIKGALGGKVIGAGGGGFILLIVDKRQKKHLRKKLTKFKLNEFDWNFYIKGTSVSKL